MEKKNEENLVTLAILTFERAQILKTLLETEGIEVYIHNVNQIQPVISAGVRVRIKESDLSHALRIIEDSKWLNDDVETPDANEAKTKKILIPVDFSDYSMKTCEIGINYAAKIDAEVVLLHSYFTPYFPSAVPMGEAYNYDAGEEETLQVMLKQNEKEMGSFCAQLDEKMKSGTLPKVHYECVYREGIAEEEILDYSKENNPALIIMGTRGKHQKEIDMIGSVTGEVIENNKKPVLTIPENFAFDDLSNVKDIAFGTSFNQHDVIAFDEFMELVRPFNFNIHLFNVSTSKDQWNEIRLSGMNDYFKKQYPDAKITHTVLADGDLLAAVEKFVKEQNIEIIALSTHRRNILARIFSPSVARKMFIHADIPLLIMSSN